MAQTMQTELYRHAIILNNLGVHLLVQGAARQALETLRDAVDVFRGSCDASMNTRDNLTLQHLLLLVQQKIQRASDNTMSPLRTGNRVSVELLNWEDVSVSASRSLAAASNAFGNECWVAFSMSTSIAVTQRDREFDSVLMMYNYALAHLAYINEANATQVKGSALSLFRMAFSILFRKVEEGAEGDLWEYVSIDSATGLTIAVLSNLAHIFLSEGRSDEASACSEKLEEIFENLAAVEEIHAACMYSTVAAAAA